MSVRQYAEMDIQEELSRQGKCFIAFREKLNPVMDYLVNEQLKAQEQWKRGNSR